MDRKKNLQETSQIEIKFKIDFNCSIERKFPAANTEAGPHVRKKNLWYPGQANG